MRDCAHKANLLLAWRGFVFAYLKKQKFLYMEETSECTYV